MSNQKRRIVQRRLEDIQDLNQRWPFFDGSMAKSWQSTALTRVFVDFERDKPCITQKWPLDG